MNDNPFLDAALQYAGRGWRVFPLRPRSKFPLTRHGHKDATVAPHTIERWWGKWPQANVGIATGAASGLVVIDVDGEEGVATLQTLMKQAGERLDPPIGAVLTTRGFHLYYDLSLDDHNLKCSSGGGLDVRANGGYVLAPPSIHASGKIYTWAKVTELAS